MKKKLFLASTIMIGLLGTVVGVHITPKFSTLTSGDYEPYVLKLDSSNAPSGLTSTPTTINSFTPSRSAPWMYSGVVKAEGKHVGLTNSANNMIVAIGDGISGIESVSVTYTGGLLKLYSCPTFDIQKANEVLTLTSGKTYKYATFDKYIGFINAGESTAEISEIKVTYSCNDYSLDPLLVETAEGKSAADLDDEYTIQKYTSTWESTTATIGVSSEHTDTAGSQSVALNYWHNGTVIRYSKEISLGGLYNAMYIEHKGDPTQTLSIRLEFTTGLFAGIYITRPITLDGNWIKETIRFDDNWKINYAGADYPLVTFYEQNKAALGGAELLEIISQVDTIRYIVKSTTVGDGNSCVALIDNVSFLRTSAPSKRVQYGALVSGNQSIRYVSAVPTAQQITADLYSNGTGIAKLPDGTLFDFAYTVSDSRFSFTNKETGGPSLSYEGVLSSDKKTIRFVSSSGDLASYVANTNFLFSRYILDEFENTTQAQLKTEYVTQVNDGSGWKTPGSTDFLIPVTSHKFGHNAVQLKTYGSGQFRFKKVLSSKVPFTVSKFYISIKNFSATAVKFSVYLYTNADASANKNPIYQYTVNASGSDYQTWSVDIPGGANSSIYGYSVLFEKTTSGVTTPYVDSVLLS